jgi:hypothetical protein
MPTERRHPPDLPIGGQPKDLGGVWNALVVLWKHVKEVHSGAPAGFYDTTPAEIEPDEVGSSGTQSSGWAAADHTHPIRTGAPTNPTGTVASEGSSSSFMRSDATIRQGIVTTKGDVLTHNATVPARLAIGADYAVLQALAAEVTGLRWTDSLPTWRQYTVTHTALQAAALTQDIELFSLPAGGVIHATKIKHSVSFAGTGITDYSVSVGIAGNLTKYALAFPVHTPVLSTAFEYSSESDSEDHGAATSIRLAATAVGANLDQSTAGTVDVWVLTSRPGS